MEHLTDKEMLKFAVENGMIDIDTIQKQIEMNERKKYLEMHKSKIWQSTDGKWYTFLPDLKKEKGRKLTKRNTEEELNDLIVMYYKEYEVPQTLEKTFNEWIDKKIKFQEITKQTVDKYRVDFIKYFNGYYDYSIKYLNEEFLEDFILNNIQTHNMKVKAWANLRTILRGMILFAKKKGYTNFDIIQFLQELDLSRKMFNHTKKPIENVVFTEMEIDQIVSDIGNKKRLNDIAIMFAIYTGMRVGEIVALKWEDVDDDFIHVNRTQIRYHNENGKVVHEIQNSPKTDAGIRDIVIVPELKKTIKMLRTINPFSEYLFEKDGKCVCKHSVCTRLYCLCDKFGFPRKGMHAIRKYYATKLINAGVEESIVVCQMGHSNIDTTRQYYYKNIATKEYAAQQVKRAISSCVS